jgi:hypothetical protein
VNYYDIIDFLLQFAGADPKTADEVALYHDHIQHEIAEAWARSTETPARTADAIGYAMFIRGMKFAGGKPGREYDPGERLQR